MNKFIILFGVLLIACGLSAIYFVTIPSIFGIGDGVENIIDGEQVSEGIVNTIIGGIILYFTTGFFIFLVGLGIFLTYAGVSKK